MKRYDIFISYRRSSYDTANLIATRLKAAGYSVFFDIETLRSGKFNEQLFHVIENCRDFILVLSPNALDRCQNMDDWVRLEVCKALETKKNIIPVMLNGFNWPTPMPVGMEDLCVYQALSASSIEYFDLSIQKLQQRYLKSKPHIYIPRFLRITGISIVFVAVFSIIMWRSFLIISKDTCLKYATIITNDAACVYSLAEANHELEELWTEFDNAVKYERSQERIMQLQESILKKIDLAEKNIKETWTTDTSALSINAYHGFLLSLYDINSEELSMSPQLATIYYKDFIDMLNIVRKSIEKPNGMGCRYTSALFKYNTHMFNSYYASVLLELSKFPNGSRTCFEEMVPHWIYFPAQYKIGEKESYYISIINTENKRAEEVISKYDGFLERMEADMESSN